jgi:hypothetical protein
VTCDKTTNLKQIFSLWLTSDSSALHMYELVPRFLTRPSFFGLPCERNRDSSVKPLKVRGITGITLLPAGIGTLAVLKHLKSTCHGPGYHELEILVNLHKLSS